MTPLSWSLQKGVAYAQFIALCFIWGASFILMKKAALAFGPTWISGLRCGAAALVLLVILLARPGSVRRLPRSALGPVFILTLIGYAIPYSLQPFLVASYGSGFIGMMVCLVPILTIVASVPLLHVRPNVWELAGVLGGLGGMGLILADGIDRRVPSPHLLLAMCVPVCYALGNTYLKRRLAHLPALTLATYCLSAAALVTLPLAVIREPWPGGADLGLAISCLLILGLLGTGLATIFFFHLVQDKGPLFAAMVTYLVPFGAVAWGWADHERVSLLQLVALVGVLTMVGLVHWGIRLRGASAPPVSAGG